MWQEEEFPYDPAGSQGKKIGKLELYDYMKDLQDLVFYSMAGPEPRQGNRAASGDGQSAQPDVH
ncbi:hypothetical protein J2T17_003305 [Paenibacillus mucilaginosus]